MNATDLFNRVKALNTRNSNWILCRYKREYMHYDYIIKPDSKMQLTMDPKRKEINVFIGPLTYKNYSWSETEDNAAYRGNIPYQLIPEEYRAIELIILNDGQCNLKFVVLNLRHEFETVRMLCEYILTRGYKDISVSVCGSRIGE